MALKFKEYENPRSPESLHYYASTSISGIEVRIRPEIRQVKKKRKLTGYMAGVHACFIPEPNLIANLGHWKDLDLDEIMWQTQENFNSWRFGKLSK